VKLRKEYLNTVTHSMQSYSG